MAKPRKKTTRRPVKNSRISEAQKAASERRIEADTLRGQAGAERARISQSNSDDVKQRKLLAAQAATDPRASRPPVSKQYEKPMQKGQSSEGQKIAGLALSFGLPSQKAAIAALADPGLYGTNPANRQARLDQLRAAADQARTAQLKNKQLAVYMGPGSIKQFNQGNKIDPETGRRTTTTPAGDDIQSLDDLMGWLSDPAKVEQIKAAALKVGLNPQSYDDIAKLWGSVVKQAADTFSKTGQKVTPWALIQMRGKYAGPDGRMQDKVTTSTQVDEMDPATARGMIESTARNMLGRDPTKAEIDDFIAKAQMIAKENPSITTTRTKTGFDGEVELGTSQTTSKGGGQAVNDQAQMAAQDMAKQSDDYGAYQAAGTYFPLLFQALSSPV